MNTSFFIAKRLYFGKTDEGRVSKLAIRIATLGVTVGLAIMLLAVSVVLGFKKEINNKIIGFGAHIEIFNKNSNSTLESLPLVTDKAFLQKLMKTDGVRYVQRFTNKVGILKTDADFKGILLKGIGSDYNTSFLKQHLTEGTIPAYGKGQHQNDILISSLTAREMQIGVGDRIFAYFFENSLKTRRFTVAGIYETGMNQFDDNIVVANIYTVNQLNNWSDDQSTGVEIMTNDFKQLDATYLNVLKTLAGVVDRDGNTYTAYTIKELYAQIFEWLKLLDLNIWVILALMACVAIFTMVSGLLILILEKTSTIGILKALGGSNGLIRRVFVNYAVLILGRGLVWGNAVGLGIAFIQYHFHLFKLDPANYYVDHVPILFSWPSIVLLNVGTILICVLALIGPSYLVSKITPSKAIRFD